MRRLTAGAITSVVSLVVAGSTVVAQSPSPRAADMLTVPIPGTDVAAILPSDWRIWASSDPGEREVVVSRVSTKETCYIAPEHGFATAQAAADDLVAKLDELDITIGVQRSFEAPVGSAVYVSYNNAGLADAPTYAFHEYRVTVPTGVLSVTCSGADPPPDLWMSMIESLTLDFERPSVLPETGPRVVASAHGITVDFPSEWLVRSWPDWPGLVGGDFILRAQSTAAAADCWLEDASGVPGVASRRTPDDWAEAFGDAVDQGWGQGAPSASRQQPSEVHATGVTLPSGPAVRADWQVWRGLPATAWVFQEADRAVVLFCRAGEPPADAWRSIAETFAFLR